MSNKTFVLYMMGGSGTRFGAEKPKQFMIVKNNPVFLYPLFKYEEMADIDGIVIVCNSLYLEEAKQYIDKALLKKVISIVPGGETRSESVFNGLTALKQFAKEKDVVLIHDATHPFVDKENTSLLIKKIEKYGAGTMVNYIYDTAYIKDDNGFLVSTIDRRSLAVGASPEGFLFGIISDIYFNTAKSELEKMTSAGALALHFKIKMMVIEINLLNLKITYKRDMELFDSLIEYYTK